MAKPFGKLSIFSVLSWPDHERLWMVTDGRYESDQYDSWPEAMAAASEWLKET